MRKNRYFSAFANYYSRADKWLWIIIILISAFSLLLLDSVSRATNTDYYEVQLFAIFLGLISAFLITLIDYKIIGNMWFLIAVIGFFLMVYTIFFGINLSGDDGVNATAWINVFGRTFQSSELVKIGFLVTYAKHLDLLKRKNLLDKPIQLFGLLSHVLILVLLCNLQGDDGAGVVFFVMFIFMSYAGGVKTRYFVILFALVLLAIPVIWNYVFDDYQRLRFSSVYNLDDVGVALNDGYQQYQARISIGSGGLFGSGLYEGARVQSNAVTFQHSDFIFTVVAEEMGFVGCSIIIVSLVLLIARLLYIAKKSKDLLGTIISFGFIGLIFIQTIFNIGMCLALLPVIGVTLPFYSAGGSSAICLYFGVGIVQSIYMHRKDKNIVKIKMKNSSALGYKMLKNINP